MQYMLLIYDNEATWETMPEDEQNERHAGVLPVHRGAQELGRSTSPATRSSRSRRRSRCASATARRATTDGPFAETKEVLGGYYLVDVDSDEEAQEWAAKIPSARYGTIEVRPIVVFPAETPA